MRLRVAAVVVGALISIFISPFSAVADNPNPSTSEIDNYISMSGSTTAKQGIQAATSNYLSSYSSFTVEMWIMPAETMTSTTGSLFVRTNMAQFELVSGEFKAFFNDGGWRAQISTGVRARIGEWQHVAYVKSGNIFSLYLNGTLAFQVSDATNVPTNLNTSSTHTSIGSNPWDGLANQNSPQTNFFAGGMDEIRTWSVARTQSQIQSAMHTKISPTTTNLVGYWDFNGTTNTSTLYDRAGSFNFTIYGTPAPTFPDVKTVTNTSGLATVTFPRTYLNASAGFKIPSGVTSLQVLIVGGGGGGGFDGGGGGGGGGVYQSSNLSVTPDTYTVQIGAGGAAVNGYTGGTLACNGSWNTTIVGCVASAGGTSKFGIVSASGGGGAGGIEANGASDSDVTATVRGGGGGAGGQNSRTGVSTGGAGAYSGGAVASDTNGVGGGGGGSSSGQGATGQAVAAGNGAAGVAANINSITYGSGGAGGSFASATVATGGAGAANGGTTGVGPTTPAINRGGGGAGGGNGGTAVNALGTSGAAGVVIIRYVLQGFSTLSFTTAPIYRSATTITATTNTAGKVTFFANSKRIPGCISVATNNLVASCSWKPALHGSISISALTIPTDSNYLTTTVSATSVISAKRSGKR